MDLEEAPQHRNNNQRRLHIASIVCGVVLFIIAILGLWHSSQHITASVHGWKCIPHCNPVISQCKVDVISITTIYNSVLDSIQFYVRNYNASSVPDSLVESASGKIRCLQHPTNIVTADAQHIWLTTDDISSSPLFSLSLLLILVATVLICSTIAEMTGNNNS